MSPAADADAALVRRCRAGDQAAWRELVERYARYVRAIAIGGFRLSETDGEDVFQELFARTYEHLHELRDDEALRPWIGQLTRRLCIDRLRASGREEPAEEVRAGGGIDERLERIEEAMTVQAALAQLPDHCREILGRFFVRDESYETIGEALQIPPGTIASRISRCLGRMRSVLEGRSGEQASSGEQ